MLQVQRIHKNTVKALLRRGKIWEGYLVPNLVNSFHVNNGWHIGCYVTVSSIEELDNLISRYEMESGYFPSELGYRTVLWENTKEYAMQLKLAEEARKVYRMLWNIVTDPNLSTEEKKEEIIRIAEEHNSGYQVQSEFLQKIEPVNLDQ